MGINYSPKIVTNGLVLCLDAANPSSYPGSGTSWKDLSGRDNNATMYGSVPLETDVVRCWNFATATGASSTSSSLGFSFATNMVPTTGNFTFSFWVKNANSSLSQTGLFSNSGGGDGYRFGIGLSGIYYLTGPTYTEGNLSFLTTSSASIWYNVIAIFRKSTSQILLYRNGIYQGAVSIPAQTAMSNNAPGLVRSPCCSIYTGKLAMMSVYNYDLSDLNIQQNYQATKGRFGL